MGTQFLVDSVRCSPRACGPLATERTKFVPML